MIAPCTFLKTDEYIPVLVIASPRPGKPTSYQLNVDAFAGRVVNVGQPPAIVVFEPGAVFQAYLTAPLAVS